MKQRILYTKSAEYFIFEAFGFGEKNGFLTKKGKFVKKFNKRIKVDDVKGFSKSLGIIT